MQGANPCLSLGEGDGVKAQSLLYSAHHLFPAGVVQPGRTATSVAGCVFESRHTAPRRTYAKEVVSAQNSYQEDKEDSQMMIFIVIAVLVVVAYMRYLDGL